MVRCYLCQSFTHTCTSSDRIYGNSDFYLTLDAATALDLDTCCSTQSTCIPSTVEGTLDQHHLLWRRAVHSLAKPINDQQNTSTASPDTQTTSIDTSISLTRPSTAHATPGTIRKTTWNFTGAQWQDFTESASYSVNLMPWFNFSREDFRKILAHCAYQSFKRLPKEL